jgi:hypothetical protein
MQERFRQCTAGKDAPLLDLFRMASVQEGAPVEGRLGISYGSLA